MSELPEIKIINRRIANATIGKEIVAFIVSNFKLLGGEQVDFEQAIIGSHFKFIEVCGESILFKLASSYYFLANMQSTGFFYYVLASDLSDFDHKNIKAEFIFEDGSKLFFINSKGYSYFKLLTDDRLKRERLKFGLDPLAEEFTYAIFVELLSNKTASIKKILTTFPLILKITL